MARPVSCASERPSSACTSRSRAARSRRRIPRPGVPDFDTLREIKAYRGTREDDGKNIDFGVFGEVEAPGRVRVGDAVEPLP